MPQRRGARDNVFATLDLESSFVSTEIVNKGSLGLN